MYPPMWGWPGMPPPDGAGGGKGGRRDRSRSHRRRDRSGSGDRDRSVDYIRVPRTIMGRIIGKQGAKINNIREVSGARIDAEDKNDDQCEFKIQGTPEAVEKAKAMIREALDKTGP